MESTITIVRNNKTIKIWVFIWEAMIRCKGG